MLVSLCPAGPCNADTIVRRLTNADTIHLWIKLLWAGYLLDEKVGNTGVSKSSTLQNVHSGMMPPLTRAVPRQLVGRRRRWAADEAFRACVRYLLFVSALLQAKTTQANPSKLRSEGMPSSSPGTLLNIQPANLSVATGGKGDYAHVWKAGSAGVGLDGRSTVILSASAFSDASSLDLTHASDMAVTIAFHGQASEDAVSVIILNSTRDRLSLSLVLPAYSDAMMPCKRPPCKGNLQFHVPSLNHSFTPMMVSVVYFTYPDPEVLSVFPNQGPVSGGTKVVLIVQEFTGEMSRSRAGMLSMTDTLSDDWHVYVRMQCTGKQISSPVLTNTSLAERNIQEDRQIFRVEFLAPPSPCGPAPGPWMAGTSAAAA